MSKSDLLSSTLNWPGKGLYGLKSSVLQTTENDLVKQNIVSDHMRNHYRRLHNARSAVDTKPPRAMILGQKCRDRARKEMAQLVYTQTILDQFSATTPGSVRATPRGRSSQSERSQRFAQSQPTSYRARSRSIESARRVTRSLNMNGSMQNLNQHEPDSGNMADKLFGGGVLSQALTTMAALSKITSTERNKSSADVLDKHPDSFSQPKLSEHQPRLVKRDSASLLRNNRACYNPPAKAKVRPTSATKPSSNIPDATVNQVKQDDEQLALREQLNRSLELRHNVEKKIKKAKTTATITSPLKKQSDETLRQFGLTEQERLQYVRFMQDITDSIVRKNLTTEVAIEKLFEIHIDRNRGTLDERRLRDLLEALKEDLGVRTSRKNGHYASVHRATAYDHEPLPPQVPMTTRDESLIVTPTTPHDERRRLSYDLNEPLPWQSETDSPIKPTITPRMTLESKRDVFHDDHLFSKVIQPKPRLSLQTKIDDHHQFDTTSAVLPTDQPESPDTINFNSTIRKPIESLNNVGWFTDPPSTKITPEETPSFHPISAVTDEQRIASPRGNNDYDASDFEDDDGDNNSEQ